MRCAVKYFALVLLLIFVSGCGTTKKESYRARAGLMLLNTEEFARNKPYKPSNLKKKIKKKAHKSLLKRSYKIR
jgi:hypothetical protein